MRQIKSSDSDSNSNSNSSNGNTAKTGATARGRNVKRESVSNIDYSKMELEALWDEVRELMIEVPKD